MLFLVLDIEVTHQYSLIGLYDPQKEVYEQLVYNKENLNRAFVKMTEYDYIVGYNLCSYDLFHMYAAERLFDKFDPYYISNCLIRDHREVLKRIRREQCEPLHKLLWKPHTIPNLIDVMPLAQIHCTKENEVDHRKSLKFFSATLLGEIITPYDFNSDVIDVEQLMKYNREDLIATWRIFKMIQPVFHAQRAMSERFGMNMMVKTNSANTTHLLHKLIGEEDGKIEPVKQLTGRLYDDRFLVKASSCGLERFLDIYDAIADGRFSKNSVKIQLFPQMDVVLGLGGLHAISKKILYPQEMGYEMLLVDIDVVSQYPSIYTQLDGIFADSVRKKMVDILQERKRMKKDGGAAELVAAYKILLNGLYGKLGCEYSQVYNKIGMSRVTTAGQLMLLYAAIKLQQDDGYEVVYLNTDGMSLLIRREDIGLVPTIIEKAQIYFNEFFNDIEIEHTIYEKCCFLNVNSYILKEFGKNKFKRKKDFKITLAKSQPNKIAKILSDMTVGCKDEITSEDYLFIKTSAAGFGEHGKIVMGYYTTAEKGDWVMNDRQVRFIKRIDEIGDDVDYNAYLQRANEILQLSEGFEPTLSDIEMDICQNSTDYYVPVRKNGEFYKNWEVNRPFFTDALLHNQYVVLNKPYASCAHYKRLDI